MAKLKMRGGVDILNPPVELLKRLSYPNPFEPEQQFLGYRVNEDGTTTVPRCSITESPDMIDVVSSKISISLSSSFDLRDYQEKPVAQMINLLSGGYNQCLLTAKTGSGKSFTLGFVIKALGQRTLILAHLSMLTSQMMEELSDNLGADVRIIDKDNQELGDVNICTFQYLHANPKLTQEISKSIGFVVVDEAENMLSESRLNVFYSLRPKYQLLMTATPSRDLVGRTPMVKELIGEQVVVMEPHSQVEPQHVMMDYRHLRFVAPTNKMMYKNALTRFFMQSEIPADTVELVKELIKYHGCIWIIIDSLKLQDKVMALLEDVGVHSEVIRGATSTKERKRILSDVAEKKCRVLLGSAPMSAGISVPELGYAFRLMPNSSSHELLTQQEGRLKRFAPFKEVQNTVWFDYAIEGSLAYNGKKRFKFYKEQGRFTFGSFTTIKNKLEELLNDST